eukprot:scaffold7242_cov400-Prasinococcus_capsulatus_cf.AAC.22
MLQFFLVLSKQGRTRLARYWSKYMEPTEKAQFEDDLRRRCLKNMNLGGVSPCTIAARCLCGSLRSGLRPGRPPLWIWALT